MNRPETDLIDLFDERAREQASAVALVDDHGTKVTYAQLAERSALLASALQREAEPGHVVALRMGRSIDLVVAQLAVVRAGCAYMPLDDSAPESWQMDVLTDAGAAALVSPSTDSASPTVEFLSHPRRHVAPASAYVMFTSGSTGRPKGVVVPKSAIVNLVVDNPYVDFSRDSVVAHLASTNFDAATFEVWGALLNGGTLRILNSRLLSSAGRLLVAAAAGRPTVMFLTTSLFHRLATTAPHTLQDITWLVFGGEACNRTVVESFAERFRGTLVNGYGPTETTTFATAYRVTPGGYVGESRSLPVGKPIAGVEVFVVDANRREVAPGLVGEVVIAGRGVASGYLGRPTETAARFIADPRTDRGGTVYLTGDLGWINDDGDLELVGRVDDQVKIRGFRIEPGEIEVVLGDHAAVHNACVVAVERDSGIELVAYVVAPELTESLLREYLATRLPPHELPRRVVLLEELPLTASGKVDRRALATAQFGQG